MEQDLDQWYSFADFIEGIFPHLQPWTIIAKVDDIFKDHDPNKYEFIETYSFLIPKDETIFKEILNNEGLGIPMDFGKVIIEKKDQQIICYEKYSDEKFNPLVTLYDSIGTEFPAEWRLWPTIISYFDLRLRNNKYVDPYEQSEVIKMPLDISNESVEIRLDYLQEFLKATDQILIIQHYNRRYIKTELKPTLIYKNDQLVKETWGIYNIYEHKSDSEYFSYCTTLTAMTFIMPAEKSGLIGRNKPLYPNIEDIPEFYCFENDKLILKKPSERELFPPVFFKKEVLKKYYNNPKKYHVGLNSEKTGFAASRLSGWCLAFGLNDADEIVCWQGDLIKQHLPSEELFHWKSFNLRTPRARMSQEFWNQQMENNPPKTKSIPVKLRDLKYFIEKELEKKGLKIYSDFPPEDEFLEQILREPLVEDIMEFRDAILILAKIFVEYINIKEISKQLKLSKNDSKKYTNLEKFHKWLVEIVSIKPETADKIKKTLQNIQTIRSTCGAAHRHSANSYKEALIKTGLINESSYISTFKSLAIDLIEALVEMLRELNPKCKYLNN